MTSLEGMKSNIELYLKGKRNGDTDEFKVTTFEEKRGIFSKEL